MSGYRTMALHICSILTFCMYAGYAEWQRNPSASISREWVCRVVRWPLFLCVCTVNRPAFLPRYSSDESPLSWWLTTGVHTSKTRTHTHTYIYSSPCTSSTAKGLWEYMTTHTTQRALEWRLNHRLHTQIQKCTVENASWVTHGELRAFQQQDYTLSLKCTISAAHAEKGNAMFRSFCVWELFEVVLGR